MHAKHTVQDRRGAEEAGGRLDREGLGGDPEGESPERAAVPQRAKLPRPPPTLSPVPQTLSATQGECTQRRPTLNQTGNEGGKVQLTVRVPQCQGDTRNGEKVRKESTYPFKPPGWNASVGHRGTCSSVATEHSRLVSVTDDDEARGGPCAPEVAT